MALGAGLLAPGLRAPINIIRPDAAAPTWAQAAVFPPRVKHPRGSGIAALVDRDWLNTTALETGIPRRALAAYAGSALRLEKTQPECGIGWNTLAAIGYVESRHGSFRGSTIASNGKIRPAIYGIALDGSSSAHIPDSDNGRFDKDSRYDRAVGPMQLIPQSWRNWRADGNGDGRRDPQNIDDAVLAAAGYLCRAGEDLATEDGWRDMIATYNSAPSYLTKVALQASIYGA
jgi:membrane-bound lytic murein transglycosylase B